MRKTHMLFILCVFMALGCELFPSLSLKPELPPITTTGENSFGAIVNGNVWEIRNFFRIRAQYTDSDFLSVSGNSITKETDQSISMAIRGEAIEEGEYEFNKNTYPNRVLTWSDDKLDHLYAGEDSDVSFNGTMNIIKIDRVKKIISGTFEFQIHKDGYPSINIGKGRFDMIYGQ